MRALKRLDKARAAFIPILLAYGLYARAYIYCRMNVRGFDLYLRRGFEPRAAWHTANPPSCAIT